MSVEWKVLIGVGGVPPHDRQQAYVWEHRLRWIMAAIAMLSVPAFYLEAVATAVPLREVGRLIVVFIVVAFTTELLWMIHLTEHKRQYLVRNWLDVLIVISSLASLAGVAAQWVALGRLMRLALVALLITRALGSLRGMFLPGRAPYLVLFSLGSLLLAGAGFYWLEPTIHSFAEGLWLAFVTGSTVGYGDVIPTTGPARLFAVFSVLIGFTLLSLMTAYVASIFIGEDEKRLQRETHRDIQLLKEDMAKLVSDEERDIRRELRRDLRLLREEIARLRAELEASGALPPRDQHHPGK
ncbi:MAG: potassium channel family protein [Betaproteobacteria bacterium]|nr:potassium channel family protein [Betaproteobacteria bacterium]